MKRLVNSANHKGVEVEAVLTVRVKTQFDDTESDGSTVKYLLEQDLEDSGWDAEVDLVSEDVKLIK